MGIRIVAAVAFSSVLAVCAPPRKPPTVAEAKAFMDEVERTLLDLSTYSNRAEWIQATYITDDTEAVAAGADERTIAATVAFAKRATRFDKLELPPSWPGSSSCLRCPSRSPRRPIRKRAPS